MVLVTLYPQLFIAVKPVILSRVPRSRPAAAPATPVRRSPGRPPVPREEIVAAALRILDTDGPEALSLRALAQRLESGTATLYRHFDSRADLLDQVIDKVLGEVDLGAPLTAPTWQEACTAMADAMFATLRRHRNAAPLLAQHIPSGPHAMRLRERALSLLLSADFPPALAVQAYATISRHVLGFAMQLDRTASTDEVDDNAELSARLRNLDSKDFPATLAVAHVLPVSIEDEFEFGLRLIINGLEAARFTDDD